MFLTRAWQAAWWESFGRGRRILLLGLRTGRPAVLAPLFADGGMGFFVGSGGSDYLDFVGDPGGPELLAEVLAAARERVPGFVGFRFYLVPDASPTGERLAAAARLLGLRFFAEEEMPAPALDAGEGGAALRAAAGKESLVRREKWFRREGKLDVLHLRAAKEVLPRLDAFFAQHVERWAGTDSPSLFLDERQRGFYRRLAGALGATGALRFTALEWNGEPIAFHFGFRHRGAFLWYKPSFAIRHAKRSPGEVLLRALLLAAADEGARVFDFGIGDEPFKARFANRRRLVRTYGLYP